MTNTRSDQATGVPVPFHKQQRIVGYWPVAGDRTAEDSI